MTAEFGLTDALKQAMQVFIQTRLHALNRGDDTIAKGYAAHYQQLHQLLKDDDKKVLVALDDAMMEIRTTEQERFYQAGFSEGIQFMIQALMGVS